MSEPSKGDTLFGALYRAGHSIAAKNRTAVVSGLTEGVKVAMADGQVILNENKPTGAEGMFADPLLKWIERCIPDAEALLTQRLTSAVDAGINWLDAKAKAVGE